MTPDEAVEAAAASWLNNWDANMDGVPWVVRERMQEALEAAAPHMLDAGWAKAYAVGFEDAKGGKNYNAADTNPYRITK